MIDRDPDARNEGAGDALGGHWRRRRSLEVLSQAVEKLCRLGPSPPPVTPVWVVNCYDDRRYVLRILDLAPRYGIDKVCLTEEGLHGSDPAALLADLLELSRPRGLRLSLLAADPQRGREFAEHIEIIPIRSIRLFDAVGMKFGQGSLPYVSVDDLDPCLAELRARNARELFVQIDSPAQPCLDAPCWITVSAASVLALGPPAAAQDALDWCLQVCFPQAADVVKQAFAEARTALEKAFKVLGTVWLLDDSHWPTDLKFYERQLPPDPSKAEGTANLLARPTGDTLARIDHEKIDALESAYAALTGLEQARDLLAAEEFLWLEHYFQRLKAVCRVLRQWARASFTLLAAREGSLQITRAGLLGRLKDLRAAVEDQRTIVSSMPSGRLPANYLRVRRFLQEYEAAIDELFPPGE